MMKSFLEGFIKGAKEAPRDFFMPAIILWTLLGKTLGSISGKKTSETIQTLFVELEIENGN